MYVFSQKLRGTLRLKTHRFAFEISRGLKTLQSSFMIMECLTMIASIVSITFPLLKVLAQKGNLEFCVMIVSSFPSGVFFRELSGHQATYLFDIPFGSESPCLS